MTKDRDQARLKGPGISRLLARKTGVILWRRRAGEVMTCLVRERKGQAREPDMSVAA